MFKRRFVAIKVAALAVVSAIGLSGCVTAEPIITPSGQQGFTIDCSAYTNIGQCYKKAGELCGSAGYNVVSKTNKQGGFFTPRNKQMVISCKAPAKISG